jgi:hypothetical protein
MVWASPKKWPPVCTRLMASKPSEARRRPRLEKLHHHLQHLDIEDEFFE